MEIGLDDGGEDIGGVDKGGERGRKEGNGFFTEVMADYEFVSKLCKKV